MFFASFKVKSGAERKALKSGSNMKDLVLLVPSGCQ